MYKLNLSKSVVETLAEERTKKYGLFGNDIDNRGTAVFNNSGKLFDTNLNKSHLLTLFQLIENNLIDENNVREFNKLIDKQLPYSNSRDLFAWGILLPWFRSEVDDKAGKAQINRIVSNIGFEILKALTQQCSDDLKKKIASIESDLNHSKLNSPIIELFGYFAIHLYYELSQKKPKDAGSSGQESSTSGFLHYQYCYWIAGTDPNNDLDRARLKAAKKDEKKNNQLKRDATFISELAEEIDNENIRSFRTNPPPDNEDMTSLPDKEQGLIEQLCILLDLICKKSTSDSIYRFTYLAILNKAYSCNENKGELNSTYPDKRKDIVENLQITDNELFPSNFIASFLNGGDKPNMTGYYWGREYTTELKSISNGELDCAVDFLTYSAVVNVNTTGKKPSIDKVAQTLEELLNRNIPLLKDMDTRFPKFVKIESPKLPYSLCQALAQVGEANG